ncbi:MAG TPA: alpha-L-arabinofuranosidase C-terminal domain-containing protein [Rhizomicrobium sp.]
MPKILLAAVMFAFATISVAQAVDTAPQQIDATLTIHFDKPVAVISPEIYGQFAEHLGHGMYGGLWVGPHSPIPNTRGFRNDVVSALKTLGVPVVRWPGGCFADQYHWRDGIGPQARRPVRVNVTWGGVEEKNEVGTYEYMDLIQQLGAKSYITGNVGTGGPAENKDWLEYMTSDTHSTLANERRRNGRSAPWKIDYFAYGNEPWGCGGNMTPEFYAGLYHWNAAFAKPPEGTIRIAPGAYDGNTAWTEALLVSLHRPNLDPLSDIDAITLHHFSLPTGNWAHKGPSIGFGEDQWMSIMKSALKMDDYIAAHSAVMDKYDPDKKIGLFVDEWSNWYDVDPGTKPGFLYQQNTLRDAITAAVNLDIFQAHADRVRMACITQMVNVMQALIQTDGARMLLTPTYHVFMMYKPFRGATDLAIDLKTPEYQYGDSAVPAIHASVARDASGAIIVSLVNLDPHRAAHIVAAVPAHTVSGSILTAAAMDARNSFAHPDALRPIAFTGAAIANGEMTVDMPAKSVVVLTLR